ncbi:hypothetical protein ACIBSW_20415 [Actinoplanes sp. NPDC049668]|uniref:hypothetical protein n=1 Tax=unclassified Actinoplanes TaxID=2626549 RepID=UPI0033AC6260
MIMAFTAVGRWRRPFLLAVLPLAAALGALGESDDRATWLPSFAAWAVLMAVLLTLAMVAASRYHPATLVARPREQAFAAGPHPAPVFFAACVLCQGGFMVADSVHDLMAGDDLWALSAALVALWAVAVLLQFRLAWGWPGVHLRPDGVHDRQALGSLFIPWDALVPAYPAMPSGRRIAFHFQRPDLVRRRGMHPGGGSAQAGSVDAVFLARAINEYLQHPEYRPAIGTEAELRRLTAVAG